MKKLLTLIIAAVLVATTAAIFASCGGDTDVTTADTAGGTESTTSTTGVSLVTTVPTTTSDNGMPSFDGLVFENKTVVYDGQPHSIEVGGVIPEGTVIEYVNNTFTEVGSYVVTARISYNGNLIDFLYATLTIKAGESTTAPVTTTDIPVTTTAPVTTTVLPVTTAKPVSENDPDKKTISGITFADQKVEYNGKNQSIVISGKLPDGVKVEYIDNTAKNVGTYEAMAVLSGNGYNTLVLEATLTIQKADLSYLDLPSRAFYADGNVHSLTISGNIPSDVKVEFTGNSATKSGTYDVSVVLSGDNYKTHKMSAKLILIPTQLVNSAAYKTLSNVLAAPEMWAYLPTTMTPGGRVHSGSSKTDYSDFVDVSDLITTGAGVQLKSIIDLVGEADAVASVVSDFFKDNLSDMTEIYQAHLATDSEGTLSVYADGYHMTVSTINGVKNFGFTFDNYVVSIKYDDDIDANVCKVVVDGDDAYKYTFFEDGVRFAGDVNGGNCWQIELSVDENDNISGTFYNNIASSKESYDLDASVLTVKDGIISIVGSLGSYKFADTGRTCELYDEKTGKLIAIQVGESLASGIINTVWLNLEYVNGIDNVKVKDAKNGSNPDTIYINNSNNAFRTYIEDANLGSRVYDIEMQTMYLYFDDTGNNDTEDYVEIAVPMIFVQREELEVFAYMAVAQNFDSGFSIADVGSNKMTLKLSSSELAEIVGAYDAIIGDYTGIRPAGFADNIKKYID